MSDAFPPPTHQCHGSRPKPNGYANVPQSPTEQADHIDMPEYPPPPPPRDPKHPKDRVRKKSEPFNMYSANSDVRHAAHLPSHHVGHHMGHHVSHAAGHQQATKHHAGLHAGHQPGHQSGHHAGHHVGHQGGQHSPRHSGHHEGHHAGHHGHHAGHHEGHHAGHHEGHQAGHHISHQGKYDLQRMDHHYQQQLSPMQTDAGCDGDDGHYSTIADIDPALVARAQQRRSSDSAVQVSSRHFGSSGFVCTLPSTPPTPEVTHIPNPPPLPPAGLPLAPYATPVQSPMSAGSQYPASLKGPDSLSPTSPISKGSGPKSPGGIPGPGIDNTIILDAKSKLKKRSPEKEPEKLGHQVGRSHTGSGHGDLSFQEKRDKMEKAGKLRTSTPMGTKETQDAEVEKAHAGQPKEQENIKLQPWYFDNVNREIAETLVYTMQMDGSFLVRPSSLEARSRGCAFSLTVLKGEEVFHVYIKENKEKQYSLAFVKEKVKWFPSVSSLIEFYHRHPVELSMPKGHSEGQVRLTQHPQRPKQMR